MEQKQTLYNPFILGKNIFQYMIYNIHLFIFVKILSSIAYINLQVSLA
jgi:hypothetical protein